MNAQFVIDHNNPKKVDVFIYDGSYKSRYPITFFQDGSLLYLDPSREEFYLKNKKISSSIDTIFSNSWRPIQEPEYRAFRDDEFEEAVNLLVGKYLREEYYSIALVRAFDFNNKRINGRTLDKLYNNFSYSDHPLSKEWKIIGKECEE